MPARDEILKLILSAAESRRFNWEISLSFTMHRVRYVTVLVPVEAHSRLLSALGSHAEALLHCMVIKWTAVVEKKEKEEVFSGY